MQRKTLGRSGIEVSALCLCTMTWGNRTPEARAHAQLDRALERGVDFIDTAEIYPMNPVRADTIGRSEEIIGSWLDRTGKRDRVVLATKHAGKGLMALRNGAPISGRTIAEAVEGSLRRLKTDHIDLYQFHWPNRGSYMFRQNWRYDPSGQDRRETLAHMGEALDALQREIERGTIGAFGLANETAWGTAQWLRLAVAGAGPRAATIQNEYSLLCRLYDTDLAELGVNEDVTLLAYAPLAAGLLTGRYQPGPPSGQGPSAGAGAGDLGGRKTPRAFQAVAAYHGLARRHGLDPVQMAVAWCLARPFPCLPVCGAAGLEELDRVIDAADLRLEPELLAEIDAIHRAWPMPY